MQTGKIVSALTGICFLFAFQLSLGQSLNFDHYAVTNGMSQSYVICIFQDSEGYMWFGTQNGLNKFDGYSFENYFNDPADSNSISNSWIFDIEEDMNGILWIATKGGLNRFDKRTDKFSRVSLPGNNLETGVDFVYGITTDTENIYVSQPPTLTIINFNTGEQQSLHNNIEHEGTLYDVGFPIIKDSRGVIWAGSMHGLASFNLREKQFTNYTYSDSESNSISHNHITALSEDRDGNILIGTENGFNTFNPDLKTITRYYQDNTQPGSLSTNYVHSVLQDYTGAIWIGTEGGGLNKVTDMDSPGNTDFLHFRSGPDNTNYISHDIVPSIFEDNSHNLWIGTIAGIDKTDLKKKSIQTYVKSENPNSVDLLDNVIASVYMDDTRNLWIGTWGKGLSILDRSTNEVNHYTSQLSGKFHIPQNHVHVIFEDSRSRIWLGTRDGISIQDARKQRFIPVQEYFNAPIFSNYFDNNRVYCIIEDAEGNIWTGTGNGIYVIDPGAKEARTIKEDVDSAIAIGSNLVYSLLEDRDQNIWIATSNGLDMYVPSEDRMVHYVNIPGSSNTLCDNYTVSLWEDDLGYIWIGTSSGVNRFNKTDSVFTHYTLRNGLPSNLIYDIIEDDDGNLWFSTGGGLAMKNPMDETSETFLVEDELLGKEFNIKAVFKADDGEMFFGGIEGLVSFYPDSLSDNTYIPPIRITSIEKENIGGRQRMHVYVDELTLSYQDYSFTIEFSALDFTNPSKNRYAYQMKGISDRWVEIGNRRFVPFTNLAPGDYTFNVRGTNNDGVWNNSGASCRITILPPWWRSNYAYASYVLLILFLVATVIKLRERKLLREKKVLEEKILERTAEIAEQKEKVEESEEILASTISSIDDLVFVLDSNGFFQEFYNLGKYKAIYEAAGVILGKCFVDVDFPGAIESLAKAFTALKKENTVQEFDYYIEKDEEVFWFNAKVSPRRNLKGELSGITIVARDITERKEAEEQLKELNATKDTFFSILAHDLKNPFSSLHSMSELVIRDYQDLEEEDKLLVLNNIHKQTELIYNLLENLLTWSKSQSGRIEYSPEKFNLSKLVEVNINLHQVPAEKKGVVLSSNVEEEILAYGDREMINTVIRNLINNAVKFSNIGGLVEVEIQRREKLFEVMVRDQGTGISEENVNKIFLIDQKFKTPGTSGETGTGLGLVLCLDFIEKNGGELWVRTEEGTGSTFHFTVPAYKI